MELFGINVVLFAVDLIAFVALYLIISLSLNLELGYTGVPNFGKVLYVAAGAAFAGAFSGRFAAWLFSIDTKGDFIRHTVTIIPEATSFLQNNVGLSIGLLLVSLVVALAMGALFGFLSSYPAIRLREDYLAMLLLGMGQFFAIFLNNYSPLIGGSLGMQLPDPYAWSGEFRFATGTAALVIFAAIVYLYSERLVRSPLGRVMRGVRDNEAASRALGKDDVAVRRNVLVIASAISAVAGALYAFYTVNVVPATYNRVVWTFWPWVIVIMGGLGNNAGVLLGVVVFWVLLKSIDSIKFTFSSAIPFDVVWLEYLLIGGILIGVLMLRPEGLLKERATATLSKSKLRQLMTSKDSNEKS